MPEPILLLGSCYVQADLDGAVPADIEEPTGENRKISVQ